MNPRYADPVALFERFFARLPEDPAASLTLAVCESIEAARWTLPLFEADPRRPVRQLPTPVLRLWEQAAELHPDDVVMPDPVDRTGLVDYTCRTNFDGDYGALVRRVAE